MTQEAREKTSSRKSTESAKGIRTVVKRMYEQAQRAKEEKRKVAYCMVMCNYEEILEAMDIVQVYTENHAGLCAVKREAEQYQAKARAEGYSDLLCGYAQVGIGFDAMRHELGTMPPDAPDGGMPDPDIAKYYQLEPALRVPHPHPAPGLPPSAWPTRAGSI